MAQDARFLLTKGEGRVMGERGSEGRVDSGARWVKGGEGEWVIFPEKRKDGCRRRWGGSIKAFELAYGPDSCAHWLADANAAKERGEESVPWPA